MSKPVVIATRGSALALAQANLIAAQGRAAFPGLHFEIRIIKTTGDKLQNLSLTERDPALPKGLFTKELEVALLNGEADLAVHSLKDLPTELPSGLILAAVSQRADVRDVLIYRHTSGGSPDENPAPKRRGGKDLTARVDIPQLASGAIVATSSIRRQAQLKALRPDLQLVPVRGNVGTRLKKLAEGDHFDALVLAAAGLARLGMQVRSDGSLMGAGAPKDLLAVHLSTEAMLPCIGQGALGIEARENDERISEVCAQLDDPLTHQCVLAERAFLQAMGGGCQSPVAAFAEIIDGVLQLQASSFKDGIIRKASRSGLVKEAAALGVQLAQVLR